MVRDAVVYGREATKFQRNLLPLSSRYLVSSYMLKTKKAGSLKFWYLYTKLHSIKSIEDTIFIRTDLNFNSTSPHGHMSVRWSWVEIHQTKTWWTGTVGNATKPATMQNGHSEVWCKLSDKIMFRLFVVTNICWVSVYWLLPSTHVPV